MFKKLHCEVEEFHYSGELIPCNGDIVHYNVLKIVIKCLGVIVCLPKVLNLVIILIL